MIKKVLSHLFCNKCRKQEALVKKLKEKGYEFGVTNRERRIKNGR